jgi:hypothetical protein
MDGVTNDVERSNEMVSFILINTGYYILAIFGSHVLQVSILQEELETKDLELARWKEMLSQKEAGHNHDKAAVHIDEAANDMNIASDPMQVKVES